MRLKTGVGFIHYFQSKWELPGDLQFEEQAELLGIADTAYSTHAAFLDYDRDGDLDLYVLNATSDDLSRSLIRSKVTDGSASSNDQLYRNDGTQGFTRVTLSAGILHEGFGLGVAVYDFNHDQWPDILVSNDYLSDDLLYINQRDGSFREQSAAYFDHISHFAMGNDVADINGDELAEVITLDMLKADNYRKKMMSGEMNYDKFVYSLDYGYQPQFMRNMLHLGRKVPGQPVAYSEIGALAGIHQTDWSWSALLSDVDNDGLRDLAVTNGYRKNITNRDFIVYRANVRSEEALATAINTLGGAHISNYMFKNQGTLCFADKTQVWGLERKSYSNGAAFADLDLDGDLDYVVNNIDASAFIYQNLSREKTNNHFLQLSLQGPGKNFFGLGTKVLVYSGEQMQSAYLSPYRGFQSSQEPKLHFGLGSATRIDSLKIVWPDGKQNQYNDFEADKVVTASYQNAEPAFNDDDPKQALLQEVSDPLGLVLTHQENDYDDFDYQFLLPHQLSRMGPALAVADVNGDGLDDMYLGGARGFAGSLMMQNRHGRFSPVNGPWKEDQDAEDTDAIFFDADQDGDVDLYVLSGGVEFSNNDPFLQDRLYINDGSGAFSKSDLLPALYTNSQSIAVSDFDNDGDLDVFVGSGSIPGSYPLADSSYLLENRSGAWVDVTVELAPALRQTGMVRQAHWLKKDQQDKPILMVLSAWSASRFYTGQKNQWKLADNLVIINESGQEIAALSGWWTSATPLDIDQDGDQDFLLGNMGLNYRFNATLVAPLTMYALDMDQNASLELWLGYYLNGQLLPVRERDDVYQQWRNVKRQYRDYASYAEATLPEILGDKMDSALRLKADTLAHLILINEGNLRFTLQALPDIGQVSALQHAVIMDLNEDGQPELITGGNFYPTESQTPRLDASVGQIYEVIYGNLDPIPMPQSGLFIPGDVRKMAVVRTADAPLLVIANNDGPLQVFQIPASQMSSQKP